ncbi:MAG: branched-chain amino acid aminotransferase [Myxococcota bacterium]|nr:branched-chain amino acid aminotransferase [Myxococcota bacterium]
MKQEQIEIIRAKESRAQTVDFSKLRFGDIFSDHMFSIDYDEGVWKNARIEPFGPIALSPASMVLHYGQAIFEGMKAFRQTDQSISLFRPRENIRRLNQSAKRLCMPSFPEDQFIHALQTLISLDAQWVPEGNGCALYLRPLMYATEEHVGVRPSKSYRLLIMTSPVGAYFRRPVKLKIERELTRAAPGGIGSAKAAGNYASALYATVRATEQGFDQVLWTDSATHSFVEECSTMNVAFVIDDVLIFPEVTDTILAGVTRKSVLQLAKHLDFNVEERQVSIEELERAAKNRTLQEIFGLGTAATISYVSHLGLESGTYELTQPNNWRIAPVLLETLSELRIDKSKDPFGWNVGLIG